MAKKSSTGMSKEAMIKELLSMNIELQHKNTELVESINKLTSKLNNMVSLFEQAAKDIKQGTDEPLMKRLEGLLDQNKNIARGLLLLEKYVREKAATTTTSTFPPKPLPKSQF